MTLTRDIDLCQDCLKFESRERINPIEKPFVKYKVEEKWQRKPIEVLFIAESPRRMESNGISTIRMLMRSART